MEERAARAALRLAAAWALVAAALAHTDHPGLEAWGLSDPHQHTPVAEDAKSTFISRADMREGASPWLDRNYETVHARLHTYPDKKVEEPMAGYPEEFESQVVLSRHGLWRRADAKFEEFVVQPTGDVDDGYALWREWRSYDACPRELFLADPWGSIAWKAAPSSTLTDPTYCSWLIRPGLYRQGGYIKMANAPVTVSFRTFNLVTDVEHLDVYDGAHSDATLLGRFTGKHVPYQITSTRAEVRLVYWAELNRTADELWDEIEGEVGRGMLQPAVRRFATAARFGVQGFYTQDMRRALLAVARRASQHPDRTWLRRKWFRGGGQRFDLDFSTAVEAVFQDSIQWRKRSRHEPGKEDQPWDDVYSPRHYPAPVVHPERNPEYARALAEERRGGRKERAARIGAAQQVYGFEASVNAGGERQGGGARKHAGPGAADPDETVSFASVLPDEQSGFSLDFTTAADCYGLGIAPYGQKFLPPLTMTGTESNYRFLPLPLRVSTCQPITLSGYQRTRDRPFTIADSVMKTAQEEELESCVGGGCDPHIERALTSEYSNCTDVCEPFLQCVDDTLTEANMSAWRIGHNVYNATLVVEARAGCLTSSAGRLCTNIVEYTAEEIEAGQARSPDNPKRSGCLHLGCFLCAAVLFKKVFDCAVACGRDMDDPSVDCMDCSYTFEDSYESIDLLRALVFRAYFVGAIGYIDCLTCDPSAPELSEECRRCHYPIEDLINTDHVACLAGETMRCASFDRGAFNFNQDVLGILSERARELLTGADEEEELTSYSYGAQGGFAAALEAGLPIPPGDERTPADPAA